MSKEECPNLSRQARFWNRQVVTKNQATQTENVDSYCFHCEQTKLLNIKGEEELEKRKARFRKTQKESEVYWGKAVDMLNKSNTVTQN